jgi:Zn ribbon nucleic-acid-binding protein
MDTRLSGKELMASLAQKKATGWRYKPGRQSVLEYYENSRRQYEIDLLRCDSGNAILDWMFQVLGKPWCSAQCFYDLAKAIELLLSPQSNFVAGALLGSGASDKVRWILREGEVPKGACPECGWILRYRRNIDAHVCKNPSCINYWKMGQTRGRVFP